MCVAKPGWLGPGPLRTLDNAAGIRNTSSITIHFSNWTGYKQAYKAFFLIKREIHNYQYYKGKKSFETEEGYPDLLAYLIAS
jgi:hypothetical protein